MQGSSPPDRTLLDSAALCQHLLGEGSVHAFLAEHRAEVFPDELFEDLFPTGRGRPSVPADVIATVMVLQALEGLSDRQAVRRLETDIAWKAAAGLALTDESSTRRCSSCGATSCGPRMLPSASSTQCGPSSPPPG